MTTERVSINPARPKKDSPRHPFSGGGSLNGPADAALPLLHRFAIVYLMLPVFIWLVGWFEWWFGLPAALLLGVGLRPALAGSWRMTAPRPATVALMLLAAGWTLLTAAGGVFDTNNPDWFAHYTRLLDLSRSPWPVFLAVGALNPFVELARATRKDVTFWYELSGFTTLALPLWQHKNNLAPEVPALLGWLLREPGARPAGGTPGPAEPGVRAGFDVYVKDRKLIYVKERCRADIAEKIRVEFVPVDPDTNAKLGALVETRRVGAGCGAMVGLPGYAVAAVRTGQLEQDGGDWIVELQLDAAGRVTGVRR